MSSFWPLILIFSYVVGLVVNRLSDDFTSYFNEKWKEEIFGKGLLTYHNKINVIISSSSSASEYLSYRRSVVRITRACGLNFLIAFISWVCVGTTQHDENIKNLSFTLALFSLIMATVLYRSWKVVIKGYFKTINDIYEWLNKIKRKES